MLRMPFNLLKLPKLLTNHLPSTWSWYRSTAHKLVQHPNSWIFWEISAGIDRQMGQESNCGFALGIIFPPGMPSLFLFCFAPTKIYLQLWLQPPPLQWRREWTGLETWTRLELHHHHHAATTAKTQANKNPPPTTTTRPRQLTPAGKNPRSTTSPLFWGLKRHWRSKKAGEGGDVGRGSRRIRVSSSRYVFIIYFTNNY